MDQPRDYLSELSLSKAPFDANAENQPFFSGAQRQEFVSQAFHFCQFGSGLLLIRSAEDCGRSFVKDRLMLELESSGIGFEDIDVSLLTNQNDVFGRLLSLLAPAQSEAESVGKTLARLRHLIHKSIAEGHRSVVSIDNAHLLSDEALQSLAGLFQGDGLESQAGMKIIFWGGLDVLGRLKPQGRAGLSIHEMQLPPLNRVELKNYIEFRLKSAGWDGRQIFLDADYDTIWNQSRGLPGKINRYAQSALLEKFIAGTRGSLMLRPLVYVLFFSMALAVALIWYLYRDQDQVSQAVGASTINKLDRPVFLSEIVQPEPEPVKLAFDGEYLLSLPEKSYMVQVMASSSQEAVQLFKKRQSNHSRLYLYSTLRSNHNWFVVVEGPHKTKSQARESIDKLPKEQRSLSPWPRMLNDIVKELQ
jgi:type II secretory pathway predicted ATPase ExeA